MLKYAGNTITRDAIERAHMERAMALRAVWTWLFRTRKPNAIAAVIEPV